MRICQASEKEKEALPKYIEEYVDLSVRYNGQVTRIEYVMNLTPDMYLLEGIPGVWHVMNLEPHEFVGFRKMVGLCSKLVHMYLLTTY